MAITHAQAAKQAATDAVTALLDGGSLEILATATVLAVLPLSATAFGAADATGEATAATITADESANATGTANAWQAKDSSGNVVMSGAARAAADTDNGEQLVLDSSSITTGQRVSVSSWTYKALAS